MPTYDFRCQECGQKFTVQVPWAERDKVQCPACGGKQLQQVFGSLNVFSRSGGNSCGSRPAKSPFS